MDAEAMNDVNTDIWDTFIANRLSTSPETVAWLVYNLRQNTPNHARMLTRLRIVCESPEKAAIIAEQYEIAIADARTQDTESVSTISGWNPSKQSNIIEQFAEVLKDEDTIVVLYDGSILPELLPADRVNGAKDHNAVWRTDGTACIHLATFADCNIDVGSWLIAAISDLTGAERDAALLQLAKLKWRSNCAQLIKNRYNELQAVKEPNTRKRRPLSEELMDVWAEMLFEKADKAAVKAENAVTVHEACRQKAIQSALIEAITLFTCLEEGRFRNEYNRILKKLQDKEAEKLDTETPLV